MTSRLWSYDVVEEIVTFIVIIVTIEELVAGIDSETSRHGGHWYDNVLYDHCTKALSHTRINMTLLHSPTLYHTWMDLLSLLTGAPGLQRSLAHPDPYRLHGLYYPGQ